MEAIRRRYTLVLIEGVAIDGGSRFEISTVSRPSIYLPMAGARVNIVLGLRMRTRMVDQNPKSSHSAFIGFQRSRLYMALHEYKYNHYNLYTAHKKEHN